MKQRCDTLQAIIQEGSQDRILREQVVQLRRHQEDERRLYLFLAGRFPTGLETAQSKRQGLYDFIVELLGGL